MLIIVYEVLNGLNWNKSSGNNNDAHFNSNISVDVAELAKDTNQ
jgi:hypothetical protein